jgi:hypothetical protein
MNAKLAPIEDVYEVLALRAVCGNCMEEEFTEADGNGSRRAFLDYLRNRGWVQTEHFGLLCKPCSIELKVVSP